MSDLDTAGWAPPRTANVGDYGIGRRPTRKDLAVPDPKVLADWQARQDAAHRAYLQTPSHAERIAQMRGQQS